MAANPENAPKNIASESGPRAVEIDRTAPAGSKNSLGAQSVRDGRPTSDDGIVEAIDEEGPGDSAPLDNSKGGN
jgi:hypothetical protein